MQSVRKGKTVAKVGLYTPGYESLAGRVLTLSTTTYESINQAKKANGLNARCLKAGEKFPPTQDEALKALAEVQS